MKRWIRRSLTIGRENARKELKAELNYGTFNKSAVRSEMADFIGSFRWDLFNTVTFAHEKVLSDNTVEYRGHGDGRKDSLRASDAVWRVCEKFGATRGFVAIEPFQSGEIHSHALLGFDLSTPEAVNRLPQAMWKYQFKAFGRNRVEFARSAECVSAYTAKYVTKDSEKFEYQFYGDKSAWQSGALTFVSDYGRVDLW